MDSGWRTSSYTEPEDTCVMVKYLITEPDVVFLGDTKEPNGEKVRVTAAAWGWFRDGVRGR